MLLALMMYAAWIGPALPGRQAATEHVSAKVAALVAQGDAWNRKSDLDQALNAYKGADKEAKHGCAVCLLRIASVERRSGDLGAALDAAQKAVTAAQTIPGIEAQAHILCGSLLSQMAGFGHPKAKQLPRAEAEYRAALAITDTDQLHYDVAVVLLKQGRTDDGVHELQTLLQKPQLDPRLAEQAQALVAKPALAGEPLAPHFSLVTEDGTTVSSDSLKGKVALLDFWGTWCPPCRESVPMLKDVHKDFAKRSDFIMLGISSDTDASAWRAFIVKNKMDWNEYLDAGEQPVIRLFGVDSYPTFLVVDRDGVIRLAESGILVGGDASTESELEDAIKKALSRPVSTN